MMALQRLDGWLLYDDGAQNPIAEEIVRPTGLATRRWFYLIPAKGDPIALVHKIEAHGFDGLPGTRVEYSSWKDLEAGVKALCKGRKRIAMEYSPNGALSSISRVDAGTIEMVRANGVEVVSSAELVQTAKARWGKTGREEHYVAAHHLEVLKDDAFAWIGKQLAAGQKVTDYDVQQRIWKGFATRGLTADSPPIVAVGPDGADPHHVPTAANARAIQEGDLVTLDLWARVADDQYAIYADVTWVAYAGAKVPQKYADAFALVAKARDDTVATIAARIKDHKPIRGFEADKIARDVITKGGFGDKFIHRTGHSIDTSVHGDGANLDDFEAHDTRPLVLGTGFSVEPGIYVDGEWGMRSEIDCYVSSSGLETTTSVQKEIVPLLAK
jgi:Xaa-Pro aminopeptidase